MNKKVIIIPIIILILIFFLIIFLGISLGSPCGKYNFAADYTDSCKCIGIKTGGCGMTASSCDKATISCLGIRSECFRFYSNSSKEIIPCK